MKTRLLKIVQDIDQGIIAENVARALLLDLLMINKSELIAQNLSIEYVEYGLWRLSQNGEYLMEGEQLECSSKSI